MGGGRKMSEQKNHKSMSESMQKFLSKKKLPKDLYKKICTNMLDLMKVDEHTKNVIKEKIVDTGNHSYVCTIKKNIHFLTPIRLMILVDYVDIMKAFKYYMNDYNSENYDKTLTKDYSLISGLHAAELKLIMLEQLYEIFDNTPNMGVLFHEPTEKIDAVVELSKKSQINLTDNEGFVYIKSLNKGKYAFESRSCCSLTDAAYILNNEKREQYTNEFDKYFLYVPKDTTVYEEASRELEQKNIKVIFSEYTTIDIVNDVSYMEGILQRQEI